MQRFQVAATGHSLNYLPEYIANRHGFFHEQGLEVTVSVPWPWDCVLNELAEGMADAALGGIWVPSMYRDRVKSYTVFAQVANRSPRALIQRGTSEGFKLADMVGSTLLMKSGGGASVGLFFKMLLRENGIDPQSVDYVQDLDGVMLGNLFQGGMGDYFITDNLSARAMVERNRDVSIAMEMVSEGGDIPWSVYYQETATINAEGIDWVLQHDAESFRDELAELFPTVPVDVVVDLTNTYRHSFMWTTPSVSRKGFERWQRGIADGRLIKEPFAYKAIVNDASATAAQTTEGA
ncbi:hypothetical protein V1509DRAFT_676858 [Lipomyces kononenkoae]